MILNENYYRLTKAERNGLHASFQIELLPQCEVYRGHFPGNPVCPGVLNIHTIKECAERMLGRRLRVGRIRRCRLTAVATPAVCPQLTIEMTAQPVRDGFAVEATLSDDGRTYMDFNGTMTV